MVWIFLLLAQAAVPSQTERGEALFFDAQKGCGNCHALKAKRFSISRAKLPRFVIASCTDSQTAMTAAC